eukprot:TRINITY_DN6206_c0_g2_i1.p1 TRINITY_DN6206_c0_g2~~TRINITY_DN6206_c0_g2_i1.p1  ORF type:complete len:636 (+),score=126.22 TRINITY_DN6206_c0_g2_i1:218-1909(+)
MSKEKDLKKLGEGINGSQKWRAPLLKAVSEATGSESKSAKRKHSSSTSALQAGESMETSSTAEKKGEKGKQKGEKEKSEAMKAAEAERRIEWLRRWQARCEHDFVQLLEHLKVVLGSLNFLQQTLALIEEGSDASKRSCSICYEDDLSLDKLGITPCAHIFCMSCLKEQILRNHVCGICRHPLKSEDARPVMLQMPSKARDVEEEMVAQEQKVKDMGKFGKYGTKLGDIVLTLQQIRREDNTAKSIVFCQWECLLQNIAKAFADFGIRHAQLQGNIYARTRTLSRFQDSSSDLDVLLLSLEQSASGTNLTSAHHVLLVHPMNALTQEESVAFELQAIGRVRRWGQPRSEIHVWRFCTMGTVEEEITRRHQKEIYESSTSLSSSSSSSMVANVSEAEAAAESEPTTLSQSSAPLAQSASSSASSSTSSSSTAGASPAATSRSASSSSSATSPSASTTHFSATAEAEHAIEAKTSGSKSKRRRCSGNTGEMQGGQAKKAKQNEAAFWVCSACTLHNDMQMLICDACGGPRPDSEISKNNQRTFKSQAFKSKLRQKPGECVDLDSD